MSETKWNPRYLHYTRVKGIQPEDGDSSSEIEFSLWIQQRHLEFRIFCGERDKKSLNLRERLGVRMGSRLDSDGKAYPFIRCICTNYEVFDKWLALYKEGD